MKKFSVAFGIIIVASALPALAQHGPHDSLGRPQAARPQRPVKPAKAAKPERAAAYRPAPAIVGEPRLESQRVEALTRMSPDARRQALATLPPTQQQQVEKRIESINQMPTAERSSLLNRYHRFEQLPAAQQEQVRNSLKRMADLPSERRSAVKSEIKAINGLPDIERQQRLSSDEFRTRFAPEEREIIESAAVLGPQ